MNLKRLFLLILLCVLVYAGLTFYSDLRALRAVLKTYAWTTFVAALGLSLLNYALRFLKWQIYLGRLQIRGVPVGDSLLIFLSGFAFSVTPAKAGEVMKSALLANLHGVPVARSAPIVVADRLTDLLALILLVAGFGLAFPGGALPAALAGGLCAGLLLFALVRPLGEWALGLCERLPGLGKIAPRLREAYESLRLLVSPGTLLIPTVLSVLAWGAEALGLYLILTGLGHPAPLSVAIFVYATATIAGAVAMLPGGLGGTEATMVLLLVRLAGGGIDRAAATAATLLCRLATLWFAVALGGVALLPLRGRTPKVPKTSSESR